MIRANRLALGLAAIPFVLHLLAANRYGFFRDELYFIVCGRHPAFGYVDQPPLAPLLAAASQAWGINLWLLRLIPALFQVGAVLVACALTRLLGGGRTAQVFTGLCVGLSPLILAMSGLLETTALEPFFWTVVSYGILRAVLRDEPRWLIVAGVAGGIGLEDKYTIAFWLIALAVGLALAGPRAALRRRDFWFGAAAALVAILPNLIWQTAHRWPFVHVLLNDAAQKNVALDPLSWMVQQVVIYGPPMAPVWIAGLAALVARPQTRFAGLAALGVFAAMLALHAKDYYLAGLYPTLFAAGGVSLERLLRAAPLRYAYATVMLATAVIVAPIALPLLDEQTLVAYRSRAETVLAEKPSQESSERYAVSVLPQHFADMHGWETLNERVIDAEAQLTPEERAHAAIFTQNFGEAAAIDVLGDHSLPVLSGHNNYSLWAPTGDYDVLIIVGGYAREYRSTVRNLRLVGVVANPYARADQIGVPVYVARGLRGGIARFWSRVQHLD
jgi:phage shock protein PspC (stress-responsive transcriptional regulator)